MKSYGQLCAVARALDVVGDRWTLLIVRELLIRESARFTDLQTGLPGIAPNLLAQRLRTLEDEGVVMRELAVPPASGSAYRLTTRGRALDGVVRELLKWGAPTVPDAPPDAIFQMHWLSMPAQFLLADREPDGPAITIRFGDPRDGFDVRAGVSHGLHIGPCQSDRVPGLTITGPGPALAGLIQGRIPLQHAEKLGIRFTGDAAILERLLPQSS
ncbi:MAG: winged helix-turn-helix transcriptional regulator [Tetrasphaera sp.]